MRGVRGVWEGWCEGCERSVRGCEKGVRGVRGGVREGCERGVRRV